MNILDMSFAKKKLYVYLMCLSLSYDNEILSIVFPALSPFLYACHST